MRFIEIDPYGADEQQFREAMGDTPTATQVGGDHYQMPIQPIDFIMKNDIPYAEGNVIKYVVRHRKKNGLEDLEKARHYIDMLISEYEEHM